MPARAPFPTPARSGPGRTAPEGERDLTTLSGLLGDAGSAVERIVETAREQLGMDLACVTTFRDGQQVAETIAGDDGACGLECGASFPIDETICRLVLSGQAPEVIPDTRAQEQVRDLEAVRQGVVGSYVGAPLRFSDGRLYGMLCCLSQAPDASLGERDARFLHVLARVVADQLERDQLEAENRRLQIESTGVHALLAALDARDHYTGDHSEAVVELAGAVARCLGLSDRDTALVEQVALLHDIGKVGIPDAVLRKPGPLDDEEWVIMRRHPEIGEQMVRSTAGLEHVAPAVRAEHERWDGKGYPDGLAGERIPLASRIVFACDAYHAMTSDRPYRSALRPATAVAELGENAGTQFCPRTTRALLVALDSGVVDGAPVGR